LDLAINELTPLGIYWIAVAPTRIVINRYDTVSFAGMTVVGLAGMTVGVGGNDGGGVGGNDGGGCTNDGAGVHK